MEPVIREKSLLDRIKAKADPLAWKVLSKELSKQYPKVRPKKTDRKCRFCGQRIVI